MSFFSGLNFFLALCVALIPAIWLGYHEKSLRTYRMFLTCFFVYWILRDEPKQLIFLVSYVIFSLYVVKIYFFLRQKYGRNKYIYGHAVLFVLLPLFLSKTENYLGHSLFPFFSTPFGFLGLSYIFFRVVQTIIEIYDGLIKEINGYTFLEFLLFFPTLSSGPIDRSTRFASDAHQIYTQKEYDSLLSSGITKLMIGLVYKYPLSSACFYIMKTYMENQFDPLHIIGYAYSYGLYMFFDFAGYSLMAIGTAYLLGIRVPENFHLPFISLDMKDFWNRWHITLSHWFRDYIFTRFIIDSARKKRFNSRLVTASVGLLLNMTIMGLWHGFEAHYILYGIYHGLILAITEIYQKKSKFYKTHKEQKIYKIFSWLITINLVMFGFLIFSGYVWHAGAGFLRYVGILGRRM